jgi:hypothetical protein
LKNLITIPLIFVTAFSSVGLFVASTSAEQSEVCPKDGEPNNAPYYYFTGVEGVTRDDAIRRLKKAEFLSACAKDDKMLANTREYLTEVDTFDFPKNRRTRIRVLRNTIDAFRKHGGSSKSIANFQAEIKRIENMRD